MIDNRPGEALRDRLGLHERAIPDFLDALVALKLLERMGYRADLADDGRAALAAEVPDLAARSADRIEREEAVYGAPMAQLLRAGVARLAGDDKKSLEMLGSAAEAFAAREMSLHAAVARRRRGLLPP